MAHRHTILNFALTALTTFAPPAAGAAIAVIGIALSRNPKIRDATAPPPPPSSWASS